MRKLWTQIIKASVIILALSAIDFVIGPAIAGPAINGLGNFGENFGNSYLRLFTKWQDMIERKQIMTDGVSQLVKNHTSTLANNHTAGASVEELVYVNDAINSLNYREDLNNYGLVDYWASPYELFINGGDCEDFAIAKYFSLRLLGVTAEKLRIVVVYDTKRLRNHAVLLVYHDHGILVLDSVSSDLIQWSELTQYQPIFSLNENSFWIHRGRV